MNHKVRILVAEDDHLQCVMMCRILRAAGFVPDACADGSKALTTLVPRRYGAVILDYHMPCLSGLEVARILRGRGDPVPVVIVSGSGGPDADDSFVELPGVRWMEKPFEIREFLKFVDSAWASPTVRSP